MLPMATSLLELLYLMDSKWFIAVRRMDDSEIIADLLSLIIRFLKYKQYEESPILP